ncbi:MAG: trigger factor [Minisyncoccia bacterium]
MNIKIQPKEKSQLELIVTFNSDDLIPFKNQALEEFNKDLTLKGYRPGKAPLELVEQTINPIELWEKMGIFALEKFYPEIIKNNKLEPLGQPEVSITTIVPKSLVEFKINFAVMPHLELPDYKKIAKENPFSQKEIIVTEEEINDTLKWLQKTRAQVNPKIQKEELPELNDEFAQKVGNFKTLEELKNSIREGLLIEKQDKAKEQWRLELLDKISNEMKGEIPQILFEAEKQKMLEELKIRLDEIQLPYEEYLKQINHTEEDLLKDFEPLAERRVKAALILKELADQEKIEVSEEEINQKVDEIIKQLPDPEIKNKINLEELKTFALGIIRNEKVFELLEKLKS